MPTKVGKCSAVFYPILSASLATDAGHTDQPKTPCWRGHADVTSTAGRFGATPVWQTAHGINRTNSMRSARICASDALVAHSILMDSAVWDGKDPRGLCGQIRGVCRMK